MATAMDEYEYLEKQVEKVEKQRTDKRAASEDKSEGDKYDHSKRKRSSRSRSRSRSRRQKRSRSRDRKRSRSRSRRSRSKDRRRDEKRSRSRERRSSKREGTPPEDRLAREREKELIALERATRTIFAFNLHPRATEREIFEFFSKVGPVTDIKLITDKNSGRSKGMAYIEFQRAADILMASALAGQPLMGVPVMIKASEAEKNMLWEAEQAAKQTQLAAKALVSTSIAGIAGVPGTTVPVTPVIGPCKVFIGNLHPEINEHDLRSFFEPFGAIEAVKVVRDASGRSSGYGFVTYRATADATKAIQHWHGKPVAERPLTVQYAKPAGSSAAAPPPTMPPMPPGLAPGLMLPGAPPLLPGMLPGPPQPSLAAAAAEAAAAAVGELDDDDGSFKLTSSSRVQLMARMAGAAGMSIPAPVVSTAPPPGLPPPPAMHVATGLLLEQGVLGPASPIPTPCLLLKNMFTEADKAQPGWHEELTSDVRDECGKYGAVVHVHVDPNSKGCVYLKFGSTEAAQAAHRALSGRLYAGNQIVAEFQFLQPYSTFFKC